MVLEEEWNSFYDAYENNCEEPDKNRIRDALNSDGSLSREAMIEFGKNGKLLNHDKVEYLNKNLKVNAWIQYFKDLENSNLRWIDFETEIQKALDATEEYSMKVIPKHVGEFATIGLSPRLQRIPRFFGSATNNGYINFGQVEVLPSYTDPESLLQNKRKLIKFMVQELYVLIECLRIYLSEFVSNIGCNVYSKQVLLLDDVDIISFNYIDTYSMIYRKNVGSYYHFIHGDVENNNMVLGISDEVFNDTVDYIYFQKFFQRIQKKTGSNYREIIEPYHTQYGSLKKKTIYIMGHSLGTHDFGVLGEMFNEEKIDKVIIFYHSQNSYENLVINLVKAFGKENVVEQIGKERIIFEKLEEPVSSEKLI